MGKDETYRILLALKKLTADHNLASVRFWGKIFGTQANYIIAEGEYPEDVADEDEDEQEDEESKQVSSKKGKHFGRQPCEPRRKSPGQKSSGLNPYACRR